MSNCTRVLMVTGIMDRGGAETMIMNFYRSIDREKIQFDFVENSEVPGIFDEEIRELGGTIYYCPHYTGINHLSYVRWWKHFFKEHNDEYSIIHGHIGSTAAIYLAIAKKYGLYTIAHSHSTYVGHSLRQFIYKTMSYPTRFIADYFFSCSKKAGCDRFGKRVFLTNRCTVFNNAIDTSLFCFDIQKRNQMRDSLKIEKNELIVGHVGRFTGEKNHRYLLKLIDELRHLNNQVKLLLVGDGPLREDIKQRAEEMHISDHVIFTGVRSDVADLLQAMDIFVMPSLYEGLPVSIIEAQTAGLPCIISTKVPIECKKTDLVHQLDLKLGPRNWANQVLEILDGFSRRDYSEEIKKAGFDIQENARWLEDFYMNIYNNSGSGQ